MTTCQAPCPSFLLRPSRMAVAKRCGSAGYFSKDDTQISTASCLSSSPMSHPCTTGYFSVAAIDVGSDAVDFVAMQRLATS